MSYEIVVAHWGSVPSRTMRDEAHIFAAKNWQTAPVLSSIEAVDSNSDETAASEVRYEDCVSPYRIAWKKPDAIYLYGQTVISRIFEC